MNFFSVFYWLTVADSVKHFFDNASNLFTGFAIVSFIGYTVTNVVKGILIGEYTIKNEEQEKTNSGVRGTEAVKKFFGRVFLPCMIFAVIMWIGYVFTPTKKDCLLIIAGGAVGNFITTDSSAKSIPADVTKFLHMSLQEQIKDLDSDVKKELGMQSPKEKLIDKAKELTKEQLLEYLKSDTTILK